MRFSALNFLLCLCLATFSAQAQSSRRIPEGLREADRARDQMEKKSVPPMNQRPLVDAAKLKHDADELAAVAQSVPPAVEQLNHGLFPKDLNDKLKRIEKLSKHLRSQLSR